jgi:hypothetical protein
MHSALDAYGIEPSDGLEAAILLAVDQAQTFVRQHPSPAFASLSPEYFETRRRDLVEALNA